MGEKAAKRINLKPCPFCGNAAQVQERATVMVVCTGPTCTAAVFQRLKDRRSAIRNWNRRATP